jgi:outer membrane beta-barrel protein
MKKSILKATVLLATLALSLNASAELMEDFDSLGGNNVLLEKVKDMNPETNVSIVQDRVVSRRGRFEVSPEFSSVVGGDAYNSTHNVGLNLNYHITPHWSVGAKYEKAYNKLTNEGQQMVNQAEQASGGQVPDIDYPKQSYLAMVNFYPIYGKMNLYDMGIVHFDFYALAGYGTVDLRSGATSTYTAGGGLGMWFSQHLTSRLEARYQNYEAQRYNGKQSMDLTILSLQIGYLL